ncbi:hypothetical protein DSCO28_68060 [Desulfosarcina ovata subsp. sediminis]|uniref:PAC domain-containing protein n=1 Tax=Desulfosarcina ovata subsp. sediminis TaxID=885957 RepID=A0A5K8A1V5_9BACT|nr:histidine kinase N-terminal 7TM domain-containing protein [Desulfosarcina ovata]BBO86240.1 hypothetical protein DSCO28_68060 [Desulfosarcina ovata subsp. sediminis]
MFMFSAVSFFSGLLSMFIGNIVYFHSSKKPVHKLFFILCLFNAYWGFTEFMFRQASDVNDAFLWLKIYVFVIVVIPVGLHFAVLYTGRVFFLQKKWVLATLYISVIGISISLLFHNYMFASMIKMPWGYAPVLAPSSIPRNIVILWLVIINSCDIILILYHLVKTHNRNEKRQTFLVAMGIISPIVLANISQFFLPMFNVQIPELTTIGTTLQASFIGFAIWKYDLFAINPATAANNIVATISDNFILLDPGGKILSINRAVTDSLGYYEKDLIRRPVTSILSGDVTEQFFFTEAMIDGKSISTVTIKKKPVRNLEGILITKSGKKVPVSVAVSILWNRDGSVAGYVIIARDITEQKQIESQREGLIKELQDALSNIKVLRGLLPICANCKKVRDDEGYWHDVAVYIRNHSEADFSHGICPECMKKLYPEFVDKL